jgi:hypothetical protein
MLREAYVSISAVSSTSGLSQTDSQSSVNLLRQTFEQLASSLQSGNLTGAQKALSDLESLIQSNQSSSQTLIVHSTSTRNSTIQNDVAALGQALNFGDLSAAQSDFSRLVKDLQPAGQDVAPGQSVGSARHHGHHHGPEASDSDSSTTTTETTASTAVLSQNPTGETVSLYA